MREEGLWMLVTKVEQSEVRQLVDAFKSEGSFDKLRRKIFNTIAATVCRFSEDWNSEFHYSKWWVTQNKEQGDHLVFIHYPMMMAFYVIREEVFNSLVS